MKLKWKYMKPEEFCMRFSIISCLFLVSILMFLSGCSQSANNHISSNAVHECLGSVGYSWCEAKNKCLRVWEEPCTVNDLAKNMCDRGNVFVCNKYVTDEDRSSGAQVFYDVNNNTITCPVVPDDAMTPQCLQLMHMQCRQFTC